MNYVLSHALSIAVLVLVAIASKVRGWPLVWILFSIYFGIGWINTTDEAVLFGVMPPREALLIVLTGATVAFAISAMIALLMSRVHVEPKEPHRVIGGWAWRSFLGAAAYVLLYLIAGSMVYPYIKDFYAGRPIPSFGSLVGIQLFRGALYIAMVFPFILRMQGFRLRATLTLGLCYSILGGIAPLLLNNTYMPGNIRLAHSFEVGTENFIFGVIVGALLVAGRSHSYSQPLEASMTSESRL